MSKNFMNARDKFAVAALIGKHIVRQGACWKYKDEWSDKEIAKKFGNGASVQNVKAVRMAAYGKLIRYGDGRKVTKPTSIEARVTKLEDMVSKIYKDLGL